MKYRKRPIVVEAEQFFLGKPLPHRDLGPVVAFDSNYFYVVDSSGRKIFLQDGDYVILEQIQKPYRAYPCKADIFEKTYDPIEEKEKCTDSTG